jgi:hypothetical protein
MSPTGSLDPRVAELLSAYLDGAVSADERALAEQWLAGSDEARAEYESLAAVKATLAGLDQVDPPFGFYDRMLRQGTPEPEVTSAVDRAAGRATGRAGRRRSAAAVATAVVASAAAFVLIGGTTAAEETVLPPIDAVASGEADGVVPVRAAGLPALALRQEADGVAWTDLPDGLRSEQQGAQVWVDLTTEVDQSRVVVFRDGVVVTVFADGADADVLVDEAIAIAVEQPADDGTVERLRDAFDGLLDALSP